MPHVFRKPFALLLRLASLACTTAYNKTLSNYFGANLQKEVYRKKVRFLVGLVWIGTFVAHADTLLGIEGSTTLAVVHSDTVTGNVTPVGYPGYAAYTTSLTYDPVTNLFYTISYYGGNPKSPLGLYQVNPDNGALSLVAPVASPTGILYSLAASPNGGPLYAADYRTLYSIDKQTGTLTTVGPLNAGDVRALAFSPDGTLYGYTLYPLCQYQ